ncbi:MAG: [NiFe]-hydrogenase assembly chaperone HybE, partial [Betaproteobacteria bacterium]|nr:[NiFe]-hydrogenase assembly chaperone HybE [Betaproteobacteria bacterium]
RMADLPLNKFALRVQAVGFRPYENGCLAGILITPWAINLVLLAQSPSGDLHLAADCRRKHEFPSGSYEFMGGEEPECGPYQFCSLFSPAFEFQDQASAVETAEVIIRELFLGSANHAAEQREAARVAGRSLIQLPTGRRAFLQGMFYGRKA